MSKRRKSSAFRSIPRWTPVIAGFVGEEDAMSWGEFVAANMDMIDSGEIDDILRAVRAGRTYHGGGGAAPEWSIRMEP